MNKYYYWVKDPPSYWSYGYWIAMLINGNEFFAHICTTTTNSFYCTISSDINRMPKSFSSLEEGKNFIQYELEKQNIFLISEERKLLL